VRCPSEVSDTAATIVWPSMRTGTSWRVVCLERDAPIPRFFETLKSEYSDGWETTWRCMKSP